MIAAAIVTPDKYSSGEAGQASGGRNGRCDRTPKALPGGFTLCTAGR